ncbi:hypothetical protein AAFF_G00064310 [Aldrovandia affinis]|uniref:Uncharacterized protein n=1 Tax=Aldrovandia affinis TaxID=143900 RepID=A0AAD7WYN5_9TELE|nr:hypothetical protein AAFF_G00064310 [Aldrovandia affinis]
MVVKQEVVQAVSSHPPAPGLVASFSLQTPFFSPQKASSLPQRLRLPGEADVPFQLSSVYTDEHQETLFFRRPNCGKLHDLTISILDLRGSDVSLHAPAVRLLANVSPLLSTGDHLKRWPSV